MLDVLFPRLSGALVASLNRTMFCFDQILPVPECLIEQCKLQNAMLFEVSMARAEKLLVGEANPDWDSCLEVARMRQRVHYDARIPEHLDEVDTVIVALASENLVSMLRAVQENNVDSELEISPAIPGLGWISSGNGDFALGSTLIEVKNTDRNFLANDYRQVLMYWLLKYAYCLEGNDDVWTECLLLNPRRNVAVKFYADYVLRSASASASRVEIYELLRSIVIWEDERT